jgi:3-oxoacyl-[acyl-carrier-protein] synthase II
MKKVVVTGIGAVTPLGSTFIESWETLKTGQIGTDILTRFDTDGIPWKIAGELKDFDAGRYLSRKETNRLDPFVHYAVAAAIMAVEDAGLTEQPAQRIRRKGIPIPDTGHSAYLKTSGVIIGSSRGGISTIERELIKLKTSNIKISAYLMPSTTTSMAASYIAQKLGISGHCLGISNACASGTNAIGEAYRLIKSGFHGPVLCGGTEAPLCRICIIGYGNAGALSRAKNASAGRPFDKSRDGFVLSEGACILVLEEYEHALDRGASIYGEIAGYGNTTDAYHMTIPNPDGEAKAILLSLREGLIEPEEVRYINAHGTATKLGDAAETRAIKLAFGKSARGIPVSSVKSMTGHMLAASGAFETAVTLMSMKEGTITPTLNLQEPDPDCDLRHITKPERGDISISITNSFGFGGVNAVLALRRFPS